VTWLDTVYADEIDAIIGAVPPSIMQDIQRRLSAALDQDA